MKGRTCQNGNQIYSSEEAPAVILGTGNVGIYLSKNENDLNTYLSRDGGHTWFEVNYYWIFLKLNYINIIINKKIKKKSHIYEIGDHGGLILTAKSNNFSLLIF